MATKCWSTVRGCKMRATLVDECGRPVEGDCSTITNECFVTVNYTAEIEEGDELLLKNACGDICVVDRGCPEIKYYNVEIEFGKVDPDLFTMLTGQSTVKDWKGDAVGIQVGEKINCRAGFALEVWTIIPQIKCEPGQENASYGYFLVPWLTNGIMGDFTIENDVMTFSVTAQSRNDHQWAKGPYNVVAQDAANTAGRLIDALPEDKHLHMQLTTISPPEHVCGCQALEYCEETTMTVELLVDADGDGTYTADEAASAEGADVPVRVTITNTGTAAAVVTGFSLTDDNGDGYDFVAVTGDLTHTGACPIPGQIIGGGTFQCDVVLTGYSPPSGVVRNLTAAVVLGLVSDEFCVTRESAQASVTTNAACSVTITSPTAGSAVESDDQVQFTATATDPEDGDVAASLVWVSSIDGQIGTGASFQSTLTAGNHVITATAQDGAGQTCEATVAVIVTDPVVAVTAEFTFAGDASQVQMNPLLVDCANEGTQDGEWVVDNTANANALIFQSGTLVEDNGNTWDLATGTQTVGATGDLDPAFGNGDIAAGANQTEPVEGGVGPQNGWDARINNAETVTLTFTVTYDNGGVPLVLSDSIDISCI